MSHGPHKLFLKLLLPPLALLGSIFLNTACLPLQVNLMLFTAVASLDAVVGYDSQNISSDAN